MERIYTRTYGELPLNRALVLAYARAGQDTPLLEECLAEAAGLEPARVCWRLYPLHFGEETLDLGFAESSSQYLRRHLEGCTDMLLFAATAGLSYDRLTARYAYLSPTKALLFQAIGAARIEAVCDAFCTDMAQELGRPLRKRYSPGYADLPLSTQREILTALDCSRKIGLTLNESMLMVPTKSVTAIVGLE